MASPVDTLTVSGINWSQAMENAVRVLVRGDELSQRKVMNVEFLSANAAQAQAWIALAREITRHADAAQQPS
jgi:hypothetical protein